MTIFNTNSHAAAANNDNICKIIWTAWDRLDEVDPYCEWDEMTVGEIINILEKVGANEIAEALATAIMGQAA